MRDDRTKVDALYDLAVKINGTAKKGETVVNMIDNIAENYTGGGESGGASVLKLNTEFTGTPPIELDIEDTEDIAKLDAIYQDYTTNGKLPPMFIQARTSNRYEIATLTVISTNGEIVMFRYNCSNSEYIGTYVFAKALNAWHVLYSTGQE